MLPGTLPALRMEPVPIDVLELLADGEFGCTVSAFVGGAATRLTGLRRLLIADQRHELEKLRLLRRKHISRLVARCPSSLVANVVCTHVHQRWWLLGTEAVTGLLAVPPSPHLVPRRSPKPPTTLCCTLCCVLQAR